MDKAAEQDPRVYFAAERTFLAWIRTGLGLIGIGFAVSRFSLFLRQIAATQSRRPARTQPAYRCGPEWHSSAWASS